MKKSNILKLSLACSLMFSSTVFASGNVTEVYNKDGIIVNLQGNNKGKFKVSVKNNSEKDMIGVKIVSDDIKGLKVIGGKEILLGDIKAGEEKVLEEKEIEYEIIKAIESQKLVKTSVSGVYKLYIPLTIAGMTGMIYLLVSKNKKSKKLMSLMLATGMISTAFVGAINAKEAYNHKERLQGKIVIKGQEYNYAGIMMWNDNEEIQAKVPSVDKELEKIKSDAEKQIELLNNLNEEDKKDFVGKIKEAKNEVEVDKILDESKAKDKEQDKEDKVVVFEDAKLKEIILNLFKNNVGKDGLNETVPGEYEFKLSDPNYKLPEDVTEIYESDMEKIEALALRGFTMNEEYDIFPYEFKNLKGLETAKNLKQLTISSGMIPQEGDEDFTNGIEYSKGSFSDLTPLGNLEKLEILRLSHNNIEEVTSLRNLKNLKQLYISHNRIKDISVLKNLTSLESFDFSKNEVLNMDIVKNFKNLKMLDLVRNKISDISSIKDLVNIDYLDITNNGVENIEALKEFQELKTLKAEKNKISNIEVLSDKTKLEILYLSNNKLNDESLKNLDFSKLTNLNELTMASNELKDISFVKDLPNLKTLDIKNNKIKKLPDLPNLDSLNIENNNIKDFSDLTVKKISRLKFNSQSIDLKDEKAFVVEGNRLEMASLYIGLKDFNKSADTTDRIDVKVLSDNEDITIIFKDDKLTFTLNEKAIEYLRKGELSLNLTYSFEYNYDEYALIAKNLKLKLADDFKYYIDIEDTGFLKVINKNLSKDRADDQRITKEEMESLTELSIFLNEDGTAHFSEIGKATGTEKGILDIKDLKGTPDFKFAVSRGIKSIKGLEYAKNLKRLKLNENEISDISPLTDLTNLEYIEIQRNRIVDLKPLSKLTKLTYLKLYNNLIEDVTPLSTLVNLTGLDLHYNVAVEGSESNKTISKGITDISSVIENMPNLTFLDVSANRISSVTGLEKLDKLKHIDFSGNNVSDYTGLTDFIFDRYIEAYVNETPGFSIGYSAQSVDFSKTIDVTSAEVEFETPFKGIKEISDKFGNAMEDSEFTVFQTIETGVDGVIANYNKETNKIKLSFTDEVLTKYNNKELKLNLKLHSELGSWTLKNVNLNFNIKEEFSIPK